MDLKEAELELKKLKAIYLKQNKLSKHSPQLRETAEHCNLLARLGLLSELLGDIKSAILYYEKSQLISYKPEVSNNLALSYLHVGDYEKGFRIYNNRYRCNNPGTTLPTLSLSFVDNINRLLPADKVIILNEQGIGDELLFSRAIPQVAKIVKHSKWKVRPTLLKFFRKKFKHLKNVSFFTQVLPEKEVRRYTCWCVIGDLFATLPTELKEAAGPSTFHYPKNPKIGISCSTNEIKRPSVVRLNLSDRKKVNPNIFEPLRDKIDFFNFTIGGNIDWMTNFSNPKSYYETLQNIENNNINFVFAIDSSFAHFTGMLNIPTVVIINKYHDWRWKMVDKEGYSTLFPSIKVVQIQNIKNEFEKLLNPKKRAQATSK